MDAVVLAAGQGTRMGPLTDGLPKPLLPVGGRPMLVHILERAAPVVDRFVVVVGYEGERIRDTVGDTVDGASISYVEQDAQVGTADAVAAALDNVDAPFLVINGDVLVTPSAIARLAATDPPAMVGTSVDDPSRYGVLSVTDGRLEFIVEKPDDPPSSLINAGLYHVDETMAAAIGQVEESERGEFELTDAVASVLDVGVEVVPHDGRWLDVGHPWDLLTATEELLDDLDRRIDGSVHPTAELTGVVVVEAGAEVGPGSVIEGPVVITEGAHVGPNAFVRGSSVVGPDARVGHAVELKNSILMRGATVGHLSYVGDSILGMDTNLGAGTTVANLRHDEESVGVTIGGSRYDTGRRKFGVVCGHRVHTGINTSLNVGVVLPTGATTAPGSAVLRSP